MCVNESSAPETEPPKSAEDEALDVELGRIFDTISAQDFIGLCTECLSLCELDIGKPTTSYGASKQELRDYVRSAFGDVFRTTSEEELLEAAGKSPQVQVDLLVTVVQAEDLIAKDVSGLSDPYCVLRVGSSPAQHTSAKHKTRDPSWSEDFQIRINDPANDALLLQVWDKDPRTLCGVCREIYDVRSCASCLVFLRELCELLCFRGQVDDFMGSATKSVNEIPCTGTETWLHLKDKRGQGAYGKIYLRLGFKCAPSKEPDRWAVLKYHYYLSLVFILHRTTAVNPDTVLSWCQWDECLSEEGLTLLFRHALSKSLTEVEQCFCRITVLANISRSNKVRVNFSVLHQLLARAKELVVELQNQLITSALKTVLKALSTSCLVHFNRLHQRFSFAKKHQRMDFSGFLLCCVTIEALSNIEITDPASIDIRKDAAVWYKGLVNTDDLQSQDPSLFCQYLDNVLSTVQMYHDEADNIFKAAWNETYSQIVRNELDEFLSGTFKPGLRKLCSQLQDENKKTQVSNLAKVELSLRAFYRLQDFVAALNKVLPPQRKQLELDRFQDWFGSEMVMLWFDLAKAPTCGWISDLVREDDMSPLARDIKYGAAVRDTLAIFRERYVQLWEKLQPRDLRCAFAFATSVSEGGLHFSKCLANRIAAEGLFDVVGEFEISKQLCVAISSLTFMASFLEDTVSQVERSLSTDPDLAPKVSEVVVCLQLAFDETLHIAFRVCSEAVDKLKPGLRSRLSQVANASSDVLQGRMMYLLLKYVDACVSTLYEHLEAVAFRHTMRLLWECVVSAVRSEAVLVQENYLYRITTASLSCVGLHRALSQLKRAFNADGKGLPDDEIETEPYLQLQKHLTAIVTALGSDGADGNTVYV